MMLDALVGDDATAALFTDDADIAAMLAFESALAAAQAECGLIPEPAARAIEAACAAFRPDFSSLRRGMARDGVAGPALVSALRATVEAPYRDWLHFRATSQDVVDTGLTLRLKAVIADFDGRLAAVIAVSDALRAAQGDVPLMGRTRMQLALPIVAGDKLDAWTRPLRRHRQRLAELTPRVLVIQFGGPVGVRDSDATAAALASRLGLFDAPTWHTARDGVFEFGGWLAMLCGSLGKIGQDVALLAQNEIGAVRPTGGGSSSAMPHKSNPVAAEVLVALARFAATQAGGLGQAMVAENERSGAAWTLEWMLLPPLAIATGAALRHADALLRGLTFVAES